MDPLVEVEYIDLKIRSHMMTIDSWSGADRNPFHNTFRLLPYMTDAQLFTFYLDLREYMRAYFPLAK